MSQEYQEVVHIHEHGSVPIAKMRLALLLTLAFVVLESITGYFAHSLALLSDAGHNFADAIALGISCYAMWIARKPPHARMTYGYHRVGILAALVNSVSLVVIAGLIFWEAFVRLRHPEMARGWSMVPVAVGAVALNIAISIWLYRGAKHDLNVRAAYLHMVGDAVSAVGVIIAGIMIGTSGTMIADPIVSFMIGGLILYSSWDVLKESVNVLLEGTPAGMDMDAVQKTIRDVSGVLGVHDLHVWTVGPGVVAASMHILVDELSIRQGQQVLRSVINRLKISHHINHTTVQIEVEGHAADHMYCCIDHADVPAGHEH